MNKFINIPKEHDRDGFTKREIYLNTDHIIYVSIANDTIVVHLDDDHYASFDIGARQYFDEIFGESKHGNEYVDSVLDHLLDTYGHFHVKEYQMDTYGHIKGISEKLDTTREFERTRIREEIKQLLKGQMK